MEGIFSITRKSLSSTIFNNFANHLGLLRNDVYIKQLQAQDTGWLKNRKIYIALLNKFQGKKLICKEICKNVFIELFYL